jgi:hypothetical protein
MPQFYTDTHFGLESLNFATGYNFAMGAAWDKGKLSSVGTYSPGLMQQLRA